MTTLTLTVSRDPDTVLQADWYPVRSDWAERFWLPLIGPTSYLLLRRFDADLAHAGAVLVADIGRMKRVDEGCTTKALMDAFDAFEALP